MDKLLSVGKILNFHGIQGEVKVGYTEGKQAQLAELKNLYAIKDSKVLPLTIEKIRFHKQFALIKFKEISSVTEVIELKNAYLKAPKDEIEKFLDKDEFYIEDLIGLEAFTQDGEYLGNIFNIVNTGAEDILSIKNPKDSEEKEYLVPFVKDLVPDINIQDKKVIINKIPGLFE